MVIEELKALSTRISEDVYAAISLEACVSGRKAIGGPARESVEYSIRNGRTSLDGFCKTKEL
jgi:argininosuccinate lyase